MASSARYGQGRAGAQQRPPIKGGVSDNPWVYGKHAVRALLGNPRRRVERLVAEREVGLEFSELFPSRPFEIVERRQIDDLLPVGAVHQGVAVLAAPLPSLNLDQLFNGLSERAVVLVLDQVTDPHNLGAILRSAAVFGAVAVVVTERNAPRLTGLVAKAASGAIEQVPVIRVVNLARALDELFAAGFWRIGLDATGRETVATMVGGKQPINRLALVLGAEGDGLRRLTLEKCDGLARLDAAGAFTSLNVSNAAAVALYAAQQRFAVVEGGKNG
ncbi:MAG: 23S rRNA (guanosine(2251)-2'-O)-methyltransferase RlmB [Alphaproteobacteria bacterium]|nr:23S rRNA (guanosine(2251)-2'-O)-methyltransferase RlmB [Alphaproteobacteria bacterium]